MNITVRGVRWKLLFRRIHGNSKAWGLCDIKRREVTIDERTKPVKRLETILHELLHATCWDLSEECVTDFGRDAARILTKLGYSNESDATDGQPKSD